MQKTLTNAERQQKLRDRRALRRAKQLLGMPTIADLQAHVDELCRHTGIEREGRMVHADGRSGYALRPHTPHPRKAHANPAKFTVTIPVVRSHKSYAVALHEVGHLLGMAQTRSAIQRECGAWLWARRHALIWTPTMAKIARTSLTSYAATWHPRTARVLAPGTAVEMSPAQLATARRRAAKLKV